MAPTTSSFTLPTEVAQAAHETGRREGAWIRAKCPYCDPEGRKKRNLAIGDRGWLCHSCHREKERHDNRDRVRFEAQLSAGTKAQDEAKRRAQGMRLIGNSGFIVAGDPLDIYLRSRGLKPLGANWSTDLRRHNRLWHPDTRQEYIGMIAVRRDCAGISRGEVHRTYIMPDGRRADDPSLGAKWRVEDAKRSLGSLVGGAVRLGSDPEADAICVGEGIESTLALMMYMKHFPGWAGLSAGGVAAMIIPSDVRRVIIGPDIGDKIPKHLQGTARGKTGVGLQAAYTLEKKILDDVKAGKRCRTVVDIVRPPLRELRGDWADWAKNISTTG